MHDRETVIEKVLEGLRKGLPEYAAAEQAGCSFTTWWMWQKETPGLRERATEAKSSRVILYEDALHKAAVKGSVTACVLLLKKHSKEWRELIDGSFTPADPSQTAIVAAAGAAAVLAMMTQEKRQKLRAAMIKEGMILLPPPGTNGNGSNGNGAGH